MKRGIPQAEGIGDDKIWVGQHARLQSVQVPVCGNFLGVVGAYSHHLHTAPIEFSAQFFQPT